MIYETRKGIRYNFEVKAIDGVISWTATHLVPGTSYILTFSRQQTEAIACSKERASLLKGVILQ